MGGRLAQQPTKTTPTRETGTVAQPNRAAYSAIPDHWPAWCDKNSFVIWHAGQSRFARTDCPFHSPTDEVAVIWRSIASNEDAAAALIALLATPACWPEENLAFL